MSMQDLHMGKIVLLSKHNLTFPRVVSIITIGLLEQTGLIYLLINFSALISMEILSQPWAHIIILGQIKFIGWKEIAEHILTTCILKQNALIFVPLALLKIVLLNFVNSVTILAKNAYLMESLVLHAMMQSLIDFSNLIKVVFVWINFLITELQNVHHVIIPAKLVWTLKIIVSHVIVQDNSWIVSVHAFKGILIKIKQSAVHVITLA